MHYAGTDKILMNVENAVGHKVANYKFVWESCSEAWNWFQQKFNPSGILRKESFN